MEYVSVPLSPTSLTTLEQAGDAEMLPSPLAPLAQVHGRFLITSDHGNADDMVQRDKKGKPLMDKDSGKPLPLTSHTLAPVPVAIGGKGLPEGVVLRDDLPGAGLANITATSMNLLGFQEPDFYQPSLLTVL